ncbi:MAG: hypothetical protein IJV71_09845, partial [Lachnospiraceae bacterium]|nr:hypothetical protein [Lachnospiraceae bacterium]
LFIIYMLLWYWIEKEFILYPSEEFELLYLIVGTHGGYGYFLLIASVILLVHLFFVNDDIKPFSVNLLSRVDRVKGLRLVIHKIVVTSIVHSFIYVLVQIINVTVVVDDSTLLQYHFYSVMPMYFVAVTSVLLFGGMLFLLAYVISRNNYLSMIIVVCVNMFIAYYGRTDILYGGLSVVDNMIRQIQTNVPIWAIYQMINVCIVVGIYYITEEIYRKKDIV